MFGVGDMLKTEIEKLEKTVEELNRQKDAAYRERNLLVLAFAHICDAMEWKGYLARHPEEDTSWEDDWRNVVVLELPNGQVTWHIHDSELHHFNFMKSGEYKWDGHSTEEKYRRLIEVCRVYGDVEVEE